MNEKITVDDPSKLHIVKTVLETLQSIGRQIDEYIKAMFETDEEYSKYMTYENLVNTDLGQNYIIICHLLGAIANNPDVAIAASKYFDNEDTIKQLISAFKVTLQDGKISIVLQDEIAGLQL
jgi:3-methyladenine DNA glycosylase AlkD